MKWIDRLLLLLIAIGASTYIAAQMLVAGRVEKNTKGLDSLAVTHGQMIALRDSLLVAEIQADSALARRVTDNRRRVAALEEEQARANVRLSQLEAWRARIVVGAQRR